MPEVSIITPLYCSLSHMDRAIRSVLAQTFRDFELILVDDHSCDGTLGRAKYFAEMDHRIQVISHDSNKGAGAARNTGIKSAQGRFIAFIDSDDYWAPTKLESQISHMIAKNTPISYTDYIVQDEEGRVLFTFKAPEITTYSSMLKRPSIGCSTAIINVATIGKRYFPEFRKSEDFALWLSILKDYEASKCGDALTVYTARRNSVSSNKLASAIFTWRIMRSQEKLPIFSAAYYFIHYAGGNILKRLKINN